MRQLPQFWNGLSIGLTGSSEPVRPILKSAKKTASILGVLACPLYYLVIGLLLEGFEKQQRVSSPPAGVATRAMLLSAITLYSQVNRWEYSKNHKKLDVVKWPGFETTDNLLLVPNSLTISFVRWSEVANFENYVDQVHSKNICLLLCLVSKWGLRKGVIVWSQASMIINVQDFASWNTIGRIST